MCVVDEQTEVVFFFEGNNFFEFSLVSAHSENTFSDHEDGAAGFGSKFCGALELLFAIVDFVVLEHKALAHVQTNAV